ncbi:cobalt ABC transporter permease [Sphaerisporangium siamense]|uniref:Energy-coupling factor transport system permease protein n=1 Tax=Sphaerisporangium siamense TaxID=795645 RepID=A0A7W7D9B2_9ACTN|nr:energy-coupling factor transporter transmembrane component T [Sphaerisporangium siamense]MBB4702627.1 energy-coupling factor transport system permease protein [Sphaerisporangium siamense]GII83620.1 cobalt ABC transporter permease [Sphaerisporangium siamense]
MDVTPRHLGAGSFLGRRDPRVLLLVPVLHLVAVAGIDDLRAVLACTVVALLYYRAAGIPWRGVRANWVFMLAFTTLLVAVNSVFTAADTRAGAEVLFTIPGTGAEVSWTTLSYAATLLVRYVSLALVGFPVAFTIAPSDLGVAFARLGLSQRLAYGVDLTFRFLPSTWANLNETVDAQRLRGYEHSRSRNPVRRLLTLKPVVVPVTVNALIDAEDTVNAMDLRGFGGRHRTWTRELSFDRTDLLVLGGFAAMAAVATAAKLLGLTGTVWVP